MQSQAWAIAAEPTVEQLHLRIAWLCGEVLFLEGYDRRRWPRDTLARRGVAGGPLGFTEVLTAGTSYVGAFFNGTMDRKSQCRDKNVRLQPIGGLVIDRPHVKGVLRLNPSQICQTSASCDPIPGEVS
jgi:hypothetical protein